MYYVGELKFEPKEAGSKAYVRATMPSPALPFKACIWFGPLIPCGVVVVGVLFHKFSFT